MRISDWSSDVCSSDLMTAVNSDFSGKITYHDSCSGLRELGVKAQPRRLLQSIPGVELTEMTEAEVCCGFGGTFCVKYPEISNKIVTAQADFILASGADTLLAGMTRSEEHTSELQSLLRISHAVLCLKQTQNNTRT